MNRNTPGRDVPFDTTVGKPLAVVAREGNTRYTAVPVPKDSGGLAKRRLNFHGFLGSGDFPILASNINLGTTKIKFSAAIAPALLP